MTLGKRGGKHLERGATVTVDGGQVGLGAPGLGRGRNKALTPKRFSRGTPLNPEP